MIHLLSNYTYLLAQHFTRISFKHIFFQQHSILTPVKENKKKISISLCKFWCWHAQATICLIFPSPIFCFVRKKCFTMFRFQLSITSFTNLTQSNTSWHGWLVLIPIFTIWGFWVQLLTVTTVWNTRETGDIHGWFSRINTARGSATVLWQ